MSEQQAGERRKQRAVLRVIRNELQDTTRPGRQQSAQGARAQKVAASWPVRLCELRECRRQLRQRGPSCSLHTRRGTSQTWQSCRADRQPILGGIARLILRERAQQSGHVCKDGYLQKRGQSLTPDLLARLDSRLDAFDRRVLEERRGRSRSVGSFGTSGSQRAIATYVGVDKERLPTLGKFL